MEFSGEYVYRSMDREERELIISRIRDILREYGISLGILFGSFVDLMSLGT
ncbi:H-NS histone family protein [Vulcanisaeta sp. JCM 16159]|uniref:H-NS histone family protein n=1 Tax=Vulcanisaeta sp. JCM 16159 TaxID=1295371 RepID=UPI000ABD9DFC|nr:H-NS histone family protein [Vulcanisaeta sp. JCM 16159]